MEENKDLIQDQESEAQDQSDAFVDGWEDNDPTPEEDADQLDPSVESQEPPQDTEENVGENEQTAEQKQPEEHGLGGEQTWEINHLGQHKTLQAKDITPELLQKGMDYDRVRQQYDSSKPIMSFVATLAKQAGMNVEDYVRMVRTEAKRSEGLSEEEAKRAIDLEDRETVIAIKEAEAKEAATAQDAGAAQIRADIDSFAKAFPDIYEQAKHDPKAIPEDVWTSVNEGSPLVAAYAKYAVAQAKAEAQEAQKREATAVQNRKNSERTTGSMVSAGNDTKSKDPFLDGWGEE